MIETAEKKEKKVDPVVKIRNQVLARLGKPSDLNECKVCPAGYNWRVNIYRKCGADGICGHKGLVITDSFYIKTDDDGNITSTSPEIVRRYDGTLKDRHEKMTIPNRNGKTQEKRKNFCHAKD